MNRKSTSATPTGPAKGAAVVFWEKYANRILLGLTFLILFYLLIQYRQGAERRAHEANWENLITARDKVAQFRSLDLLRLPAEQIGREAKSLEDTAAAALDAVLNDSSQSKLYAEANVARGDLYWTLANLPEVPGAATQPSLRPTRTSDEYLATAEAAYRKAAGQTEDKISAVTAQFGLAAIAENRGQWDDAKKLYDAVAADANAMPSIKTLAIVRAAQVDQLRRPLYVTPSTAPAVTTDAATTVPVATTAPAAAAAPTTAPTTAPAQ